MFGYTLRMAIASLASICLFEVEAGAQPSPVSFTDLVIREVECQEVTPELESAVLAAYQAASTEMSGEITDDLKVSYVQPFLIPERNGVQELVASHGLADGANFGKREGVPTDGRR